jgi:hypothetical protein
MLLVSNRLSLSDLVSRAGFANFRDMASQLESHGFRKLSDNTLSAWRHNKWKAKLTAREASILCVVLKCSIDELAEAFEDSDNE